MVSSRHKRIVLPICLNQLTPGFRRMFGVACWVGYILFTFSVSLALTSGSSGAWLSNFYKVFAFLALEYPLRIQFWHSLSSIPLLCIRRPCSWICPCFWDFYQFLWLLGGSRYVCMYVCMYVYIYIGVFFILGIIVSVFRLFLGFLFTCFFAFLLFCFRASLLLCFPCFFASLLFCLFAVLLLRFSASLLSLLFQS